MNKTITVRDKVLTSESTMSDPTLFEDWLLKRLKKLENKYALESDFVKKMSHGGKIKGYKEIIDKFRFDCINK